MLRSSLALQLPVIKGDDDLCGYSPYYRTGLSVRSTSLNHRHNRCATEVSKSGSLRRGCRMGLNGRMRPVSHPREKHRVSVTDRRPKYTSRSRILLTFRDRCCVPCALATWSHAAPSSRPQHLLLGNYCLKTCILVSMLAMAITFGTMTSVSPSTFDNTHCGPAPDPIYSLPALRLAR